MGAGGLLLMLGIIVITMVDRNGTKTVVRLPAGIDTDLILQPGSKIRIHDESGEIAATTTSGGERQPAEHASEISNRKSAIPDVRLCPRKPGVRLELSPAEHSFDQWGRQPRRNYADASAMPATGNFDDAVSGTRDCNRLCVNVQN